MNTIENNIFKPGIHADNKTLALIAQAAENSKSNSYYYDKLIDYIPSEEDKAIMKKIRFDEIKCGRILGDIYFKLADQYPDTVIDRTQIIGNLITEFKNFARKKLDDVERYRNIYFLFSCLEIRDILFEIIIDSQNQALEFNYLHNKYSR